MNYVDKADQNGYTVGVVQLLAGLSCVKARPTGKKQSGRAGQTATARRTPAAFLERGKPI